MPISLPDDSDDSRWSRMVDQCAGVSAPATGSLAKRPSKRPADGAAREVQGPPVLRDVLRTKLPEVAQLIKTRRADLIPPHDIAQYLTLDWLEWHGGSLRLTQVGRNVCDQSREV